MTGILRVDVEGGHEGNDVTKGPVPKVKKWLEEESGYPLELTTAVALASAGFEVVQGDYFRTRKAAFCASWMLPGTSRPRMGAFRYQWPCSWSARVRIRSPYQSFAAKSAGDTISMP